MRPPHTLNIRRTQALIGSCIPLSGICLSFSAEAFGAKQRAWCMGRAHPRQECWRAAPQWDTGTNRQTSVYTCQLHERGSPRQKWWRAACAGCIPGDCAPCLVVLHSQRGSTAGSSGLSAGLQVSAGILLSCRAPHLPWTFVALQCSAGDDVLPILAHPSCYSTRAAGSGHPQRQRHDTAGAHSE